MIVREISKKNGRKVQVSKTVYADGNNYYLMAFFTLEGGYVVDDSFKQSPDSAHSLEKAINEAHAYLNK